MQENSLLLSELWNTGTGCGVPILAGTQNPTGHCPEKPAPADPVRAVGLEKPISASLDSVTEEATLA